MASHIFYEPTVELPDPFAMRLLQVSPDQGSDGVCGINYLQRKMYVNIEAKWGPSHRAWNCAKGPLRFAQLWTFEILMVICVNSGFGAWHDDGRHWQVRDVVEGSLVSMNQDTESLFHRLAPGLIQYIGAEKEAGNPDILPLLYDHINQ